MPRVCIVCGSEYGKSHKEGCPRFQPEPKKMFTADEVAAAVIAGNKVMVEKLEELCNRVALAEHQRDKAVADLEFAYKRAANALLRREPEYKHDFVCISADKMRSEICHAAGDLTEHTGEYRTFKLV